MDEIFQIIKKHIIETGFKPSVVPNIFITGGGSNLSNLEDYCSNFFGTEVKKLDKSDINGKEEDLEKNFIACLGALIIVTDGWETEAIPERGNKNY